MITTEKQGKSFRSFCREKGIRGKNKKKFRRELVRRARERAASATNALEKDMKNG